MSRIYLLLCFAFFTSLQGAEVDLISVVPKEIIRGLSSSNAQVRASSMYALRDLVIRTPNADSRNAVTLIASRLSDADAVVRRAGATSLRDVGKLAKPARKAMLEVLGLYPDSDASVFLLQAIAGLGDCDSSTQTKLEEYLEVTQYGPGKEAALHALAKIGSAPLNKKTSFIVEKILSESQGDLLVELAALDCFCRLETNSDKIGEYLHHFAGSGNALEQQAALECIKSYGDKLNNQEVEDLIKSLCLSNYAAIASEARDYTKEKHLNNDNQ